MNPKTNEELVRKVEILNKKYFNGKFTIINKQYHLSDYKLIVVFKTRKSIHTLGTCSFEKRTKVCKIEINPLLKDYDITETLLHEIIHVDNFLTLGYSSHGDEFKKVARTITIKSDGKYTFKSTTTDKKLNEVISSYAKEQRRIRNAKRFNMSLKEYNKFIKSL